VLAVLLARWEVSMRSAFIFSVRVQGSHQFGWKWRAADAPVESRKTFLYFYDCVQDGLRAGYRCRYEGMRGAGEDAAVLHPRPGQALRAQVPRR
jgi:hypothetical protein